MKIGHFYHTLLQSLLCGATEAWEDISAMDLWKRLHSK